MEKKFIDRQEELARLEELYNQKQSQLIVTYGRRRVGKSALLRHFCDGKKKYIFFTGRKGENQNDLSERFLKSLSDFFEDPLIAKLKITDWKEIFDLIDAKQSKEKLIVVLDEFQWICPVKSTLISALQEYWDRKKDDDKKIFLVLCGSIISFMEKKVLSEKSPLYGRRTFSFELEPMSFSSARLFFPKMDITEQAEVIITLGGIPSYLELIQQKDSFAQNINKLALTKNGYLVDEILFILREQLKVPKRYYVLLKILSEKNATRNELSKEAGISNSGTLNLYIKNLLDMHLIKETIPITKGETSKSVRYAIWDEFLRFYFNFILPNEERIRLNDDDWLFDSIIAPRWEGFCGRSFELFCVKNIKSIISSLGIKDVFLRSGSFWQVKTKEKEGVQIDMVIERTDNVTHLIECKWSSGKIGTSIIGEVERKKRLYPNPHHHTLKTVLITTYGITEQVEKSNVIDNVITLRDFMVMVN